MYTREVGNPSIMSSPVLAPTLVGDATASTNCQAGDLSCDMGGTLLISPLLNPSVSYPTISTSMPLLVAQLRAKNVARKREQVEQAVRESEHEAARKKSEEEATTTDANVAHIPKGANADGNDTLNNDHSTSYFTSSILLHSLHLFFYIR